MGTNGGSLIMTGAGPNSGPGTGAAAGGGAEATGTGATMGMGMGMGMGSMGTGGMSIGGVGMGIGMGTGMGIGGGGVAVGGNGTGGNPAHEATGAMSSGSNQPPATEYTLQGVMRFLQSEWHRHERDRNTWEIEKQEMKSRIASLEGETRRSNATQNALKKYVSILEKKVKKQNAQLVKAGHESEPDADLDKPKSDRDAMIREKLRSAKSTGDAPDQRFGFADDESTLNDLKAFLDQCQAEFTYLMITPANPIPPRESPPLPVMDQMREGEIAFAPQFPNQMFPQQDPQAQPSHVREPYVIQGRPAPSPNHPQPPSASAALPTASTSTSAPSLTAASSSRNGPDKHSAPAMVRSSNMEHNPSMLGRPAEWSQPSASGNSRISSDRAGRNESGIARTDLRGAALADAEREMAADAQAVQVIPTSGPDTDGWDFGDGNLAELQQQSPSSGRLDTDVFPAADVAPRSPKRGAFSHRRKSSATMSRRRSADHDMSLNSLGSAMKQKGEGGSFKLRFGLRGHLDTVRTVIFSGDGSPGEPEICTGSDDGTIKRFHIPDRHPGHASGGTNGVSISSGSDLDVTADFTHRGHEGMVLCLASRSPATNFSTGGRAQGDGWIFSGGHDATIRVWERGRVDPKATLEGHADAVWALCLLPATLGAVFGPTKASLHGSPDRILLASGSADGTVRVWAVSAPPQLTSPQPSSSRRGPGGRVRGNSTSSGSAFPSSPQPNTASNSPFHYSPVHTISRPNSKASPTCITPLGGTGEAFVVSYSDASIIVYDTRSGEEIGSMASLETYNGTVATAVNAVVATTVGLDQTHHQPGLKEEDAGGGGAGPTGGGRAMAGSGVEGVVISGHEDCFIRFFDANSGQCTYSMVAHPVSISSLSLSPDGRELVSAGHDASLRFWSLETRSCTQEITSHRVMRGEGVCSVVWSQDGRWVVSGGGDGVAKVFAR